MHIDILSFLMGAAAGVVVCLILGLVGYAYLMNKEQPHFLRRHK